MHVKNIKGAFFFLMCAICFDCLAHSLRKQTSMHLLLHFRVNGGFTHKQAHIYLTQGQRGLLNQYMIHHYMRDSITNCLMAGCGNTEMWLNPSQLFPRISKFIHVHVCLSKAVGAKTTFTLSQKKNPNLRLCFEVDSLCTILRGATKK